MSNPGWRCPGCGRCYAPWKAKCDECGPTITLTGAEAKTSKIQHAPPSRAPTTGDDDA